MPQSAKSKRERYFDNSLHAGVFLALLIFFWVAFSAASLQTSIMKRITDSDFTGYSYYSVVSTITQVSAKNKEIKSSEKRINDFKTDKKNVFTGSAELNQANRKVDRIRRDAFRELLIGAGPQLTSGQTRLANRIETDDSTVAQIDFVLNEAEKQADPQAPNPIAELAPPTARPVLRSCVKAQQISGRYTNLGEQIPTEAINSTVEGCLLSNRTAGLSPETGQSLMAAKQALAEKIDQSQGVKDKLAEIEAAIGFEESEIAAIEAEIRENTDLPTGTDALTPLQIYRQFPEIVHYGRLGFGWGDDLLMLQHELILGLLTALAGAVGGLSKYFLRRYTRGPDSKAVGEVEPHDADKFLPTSLAGSFAGLSVFLILFGGLAVFQIGGNEAGATANYSSFAAFGFLAGMFSDRVNAWLESIAGRVFSGEEEQAEAAARRDLDELTKAIASDDKDKINEILKKREEAKAAQEGQVAAGEGTA